MIEELEDRIKKLRALAAELNVIMNDVLRANAAFIIQLQVEQHRKGLNAKGSKIGTYAESTKKTRRRKGLQVGFVDLEFTGNYHRSQAIAYGKDFIELDAPDVLYSIFLDNHYNDLHGLTEESKERLKEKIRPMLYDEINRRLS